MIAEASLNRFYYALVGVQAAHLELLPSNRLEGIQSLARQRRNELVSTIDITADEDERDLLRMQAMAAGSRVDGAELVLRAAGHSGGKCERYKDLDTLSLVRYCTITSQELSPELKG